MARRFVAVHRCDQRLHAGRSHAGPPGASRCGTSGAGAAILTHDRNSQSRLGATGSGNAARSSMPLNNPPGFGFFVLRKVCRSPGRRRQEYRCGSCREQRYVGSAGLRRAGRRRTGITTCPGPTCNAALGRMHGATGRQRLPLRHRSQRDLRPFGTEVRLRRSRARGTIVER